MLNKCNYYIVASAMAVMLGTPTMVSASYVDNMLSREDVVKLNTQLSQSGQQSQVEQIRVTIDVLKDSLNQSGERGFDLEQSLSSDQPEFTTLAYSTDG